MFIKFSRYKYIITKLGNEFMIHVNRMIMIDNYIMGSDCGFTQIYNHSQKFSLTPWSAKISLRKIVILAYIVSEIKEVSLIGMFMYVICDLVIRVNHEFSTDSLIPYLKHSKNSVKKAVDEIHDNNEIDWRRGILEMQPPILFCHGGRKGAL